MRRRRCRRAWTWPSPSCLVSHPAVSSYSRDDTSAASWRTWGPRVSDVNTRPRNEASQNAMVFRAFPLDGALLLFDRDTGTNVLLDGPETAALRLLAPRSIQFGITNRCNLACAFCSRDLEAGVPGRRTRPSSFSADLARAGVLEVAFGGGEPFAFRGFEGLVARLSRRDAARQSTRRPTDCSSRALAVRSLRGKLGELRLSLYDDNDWRRHVRAARRRGCALRRELPRPSRAVARRSKRSCSSSSRSAAATSCSSPTTARTARCTSPRPKSTTSPTGSRCCTARSAAAAGSASTSAGASGWRPCRASSNERTAARGATSSCSPATSG